MADNRPLYAHWFRCRTCGNRFSVKRLTADSSKVKAPNCPRRSCIGKSRQSHVPDIGFDPSEGKAPALGGSIPTRAFDTAMEMTMQDHGMTDIRDDARPGEPSVPKLRPDLQERADNFFGGQKKQNRGTRGKVDLSGLYGERASQAQNGTPQGTKFVQEGGHAIAPILNSKPTGSSPIPNYTSINPPGT